MSEMSHAQPKTLFDDRPASLTGKPLVGQILRVYDALRQTDRWLSIPELQSLLLPEDPANSISAQLRALKGRGFRIEGRRRSGTGGTWEYRLFATDAPER